MGVRVLPSVRVCALYVSIGFFFLWGFYWKKLKCLASLISNVGTSRDLSSKSSFWYYFLLQTNTTSGAPSLSLKAMLLFSFWLGKCHYYLRCVILTQNGTIQKIYTWLNTFSGWLILYITKCCELLIINLTQLIART
jgi:hypothetical protein